MIPDGADATSRVPDHASRERGNVENLTHFTSESARAAGKRSGEVRRKKREALAEARERERRLLATFDRGTLGDTALMTAGALIGRVINGEIPVRNGSEAAALIRELVNIGRLEKGESTSNHLAISLNADELRSRIAERLSGPVPSMDIGGTNGQDPIPGG